MLGNSVIVCANDSRVSLISNSLQGLAEAHEYGPFVPGRKIRNVFKEDSPWLHGLNHSDEPLPKVCSGVIGWPDACLDQASYLRSAGSRERLAGNTTCDKIDRTDAPSPQMFKEILRICEVSEV